MQDVYTRRMLVLNAFSILTFFLFFNDWCECASECARHHDIFLVRLSLGNKSCIVILYCFWSAFFVASSFIYSLPLQNTDLCASRTVKQCDLMALVSFVATWRLHVHTVGSLDLFVCLKLSSIVHHSTVWPYVLRPDVTYTDDLSLKLKKKKKPTTVRLFLYISWMSLL